MRYIQHLILYIFLAAFYARALCTQSTDSFNRYYFSSYDELVRFFEKPVEDGASFSKQVTEFYADVYHKKTLEQAVTACTYQNSARGIGHYASHVITYIDPKTKQRYELPSISFSTGSYHNNPGSVQDIETSSHWKIIAPSGEAHDSAEYINSPSTFDLLWQKPNNLSDVPVIQCSGQVVQRPDGSNSFQVSVGDQDVCMQAHAHSQSLNDRYRAATQHHQQKMLTPPDILLQEARNLHQVWMKCCEGYLKKRERGTFREKKYQLLSLNPPMPPISPVYNYYEVSDYNEAVKTHDWLYAEIEKLSYGFIAIYREKWTSVDKDKVRNFKNFYESSVDRITEEFYKKYPSQKPKTFKAICLSHAVVFHHYDAAMLTALSETWELNRASQRYSKRMQALNNVKQSKGLMRDYSKFLQRHAPFTDEYADTFNNCYGTALDQQLHEELCQTRVHMIDLVSSNPSSEYPGFYAPIVNRCTALAKQERNIDTAFSLSDYSDALVRIVSKGVQMIESGLRAIRDGQQLVAECEQLTPRDIKLMKDVLCGAAHGLVDAAQIALTPEHWVELVKGMPMLLFQTLVVLGKMENQGERLLLALFDPDPNAFGREFQNLCDKTQQKVQLIQQTFEQTIAKMTTLSDYEFSRHASCLGATLVLDCVAMHGLTLATSSAGRKFVNKTATLFESAKAEEVVAEVAGVGKIAVEEGAEFAINVLPSMMQDGEFVNSKILGNSISERLKKFISRFRSKQVERTFATGAREISAKEYLALDEWAIKQYESIRNISNDVAQIASNTQLPLHKIERIKKHVFFENHILRDKTIKPFHPDPAMASAWQRLTAGNFTKNDLALLEHEYFESKFERLFRTDYDTAHAKTVKSGRTWDPLI